MFKIIIHVFQMEINCILMKYILMKYDMCMIIIQVFQMDIICILIKYCLMFLIIINVFQMYINCIFIRGGHRLIFLI